jgi:hypothetical protein
MPEREEEEEVEEKSKKHRYIDGHYVYCYRGKQQIYCSESPQAVPSRPSTKRMREIKWSIDK